jgi:hypothetical protein
VTIAVKPFTCMSTMERRKIAAAAKRYGSFLGLEAHVASSSR